MNRAAWVTRGRRALAAIAAVALLALPGAQAAAGTRAPEPLQVTVDREEARPGERITITLHGFQGRAATVSICGNLARRGSGDCNMVASQGVGLEPGGPTVTELVLSLPPAPCPCVVRASTSRQDQVAAAEIRLVGAPEAPVVDPAAGPLVSVSVAARPAPRGLIARWRAALGGPTPYAVTVSVRNDAPTLLSDLVLVGSLGRPAGRDRFVLPAPGPLQPGEERVQTVHATVGAPAVGRLVWDVTAAGAGEPVRVEAVTRRVPPLLVLAASVLAVDVAAIARRRVARRKALAGSVRA